MPQTYVTNAVQVCDICQNIRAVRFYDKLIKMIAVAKEGFHNEKVKWSQYFIVGAASPLCPQGKVLFLRRYGALAVPLKCDCLIDRYFVITHTYNRGAL